MMMGMKAKGAAKGKAGAGAKASAKVGMKKGSSAGGMFQFAAKPAKKAKASYGK